MDINEIINTIETFAPLKLQSSWDCSGWVIDNSSDQFVIARQKTSKAKEVSTEAISPRVEQHDIKKILLAVTVNEKIVDQAVEQGCDLIISHHPLFYVPFIFQKGISIYSAHTNLDVAKGGTTDSLISLLELGASDTVGEFLRVVELEQEIPLYDFVKLLKNKLNLESVKVANNNNIQKIKKLAFCAGSGAEFIKEVQEIDADVFVTGDVKFHTAFDSELVLIDVGHFESERPVLDTVRELLKPLDVEVIIADEKSPFTLC